jgi:D-beta-D-heptose 7-phosphate kinase/D-beta-D-heptose 1-phosphate adenosyltransferase
VRIDREERITLRQDHAAAALRRIETLLPAIDAIILEDYGKGLLTQEFADAICALANRARKIIAVDPNPHNPLEWQHVTVIKPESGGSLRQCRPPAHRTGRSSGEDRELLEVGRILSENGMRTICSSRSANKA